MTDRYVVRVRGVLGPLLRITFGDLHCEAVPCQTTIRGPLSDDALRRLLSRLDESGVDLIHLERSCR
jgi:hypothetical protein